MSKPPSSSQLPSPNTIQINRNSKIGHILFHSGSFAIDSNNNNDSYTPSIYSPNLPYTDSSSNSVNPLQDYEELERYIVNNSYELPHVIKLICPILNNDKSISNNSFQEKYIISQYYEIPKQDKDTQKKDEAKQMVNVKLHLQNILNIMDISDTELVSSLDSYFDDNSNVDKLDTPVIEKLGKFNTLYHYYKIFKVQDGIYDNVDIKTYIDNNIDRLSGALLKIDEFLRDSDSNPNTNKWCPSWVIKELNTYFNLRLKQTETINNSDNQYSTEEYIEIKKDIIYFFQNKNHNMRTESKQEFITLLDQFPSISTKVSTFKYKLENDSHTKQSLSNLNYDAHNLDTYSTFPDTQPIGDSLEETPIISGESCCIIL